MRARRTIVAMGGGGFQMEPDNPLLDDHVLALARERSGRARPRVCLIPTATTEDPGVIADFERLFAPRAEPRVLRLFVREDDDLAAVIRDQDAVYVTGGNTANLLALWRLHGLDRVLRDAWNAGVVMAGMSAGAICWFESCTTDSFGPTLRPLAGGLGILHGSLSPHYHGEAQRRPLYLRLVGDGTLPAGYAVDDSAALVFDGRELVEVVTSAPDAGAWRVEPDGAGSAIETELPTRFLGG
ncbi:MAG TPA: peptidase E [Candidatus Limnocylindrales bacterium]|nr:peptidase E [Candidatus Limnocylindrales bacterium]